MVDERRDVEQSLVLVRLALRRYGEELESRTFFAWQRLHAWCWLDRAVTGSNDRRRICTSSVSASYFHVPNMALAASSAMNINSL